MVGKGLLSILTLLLFIAVLWKVVPAIMTTGNVIFDIWLGLATILFLVFWIAMILRRDPNDPHH